MPHYTSADAEAFINRITFDFVAQLQHRLQTAGTTQTELAARLDVTEGAVSQLLNLSRTNLNLKTMVRYARALGMKVAIVAYDDRDPRNENGPVGSDIFNLAWEKIGRPRDVWSVDENMQAFATNQNAAPHVLNWISPKGWVNYSGISSKDTSKQLPSYIYSDEMEKEKASTALCLR